MSGFPHNHQNLPASSHRHTDRRHKPVAMEKMPLQYFQAVLLERAFAQPVISVQIVRNMLYPLLPVPFSQHVPRGFNFPDDVDLMKKCIIEGGSAVYNHFIRQLNHYDSFGYPEILTILTDHPVKQLYRYVWISSRGVSIQRRGQSWFTDEDNCRAAGLKDKPLYTSDETLTLCVESSCSCYIHHIDERRYTVIGLPCRCFDEKFVMPSDVKFTNGIRPPTLSTPRPRKGNVRRIQEKK